MDDQSPSTTNEIREMTHNDNDTFAKLLSLQSTELLNLPCRPPISPHHTFVVRLAQLPEFPHEVIDVLAI